MKENFWKELNKPIVVLAPMAGVTDSAFRYLCQKFGADAVYSEMVNVTAIYHETKKTLDMLKSYRKKVPFVVQFFGNNIGHFSQAVKIVEEQVKPDGFDINFGCPAPKIMKNEGGISLFKNMKLAGEIIEEVISATALPVSIKVRIRADEINIFDFLACIKGMDIKAIMVHGRSCGQGMSGRVDFETIKKVKEMFSGVVLANGGVRSHKNAEEMLVKTGADGVGVAQGALGRPWLFSEIKEKRDMELSRKDIFKIALKHAKLIKKLKGKDKLVEMRKHLCWYVSGLPDAKKLRRRFVKINTIKDIKKIIKENFEP